MQRTDDSDVINGLTVHVDDHMAQCLGQTLAGFRFWLSQEAKERLMTMNDLEGVTWPFYRSVDDMSYDVAQTPSQTIHRP